MNSPTHQLTISPLGEYHGVQFLLARDELTHPELPGNKWRKLKHNLQEADRLGLNTLLTFGGAYSNHLAAVAAAGRLLGRRTVGFVRGDELATRLLNPTLARARADGMELRFLDRETYRRKHEPEFLAALLHDTGPAYVLPEGGSNALALPGCAELARELLTRTNFDVLAVACGTGGTLAGLLTGLDGQRRALGLAALKGAGFLRADINQLTQQATGRTYTNWELNTDYHGGGYARLGPELRQFIVDFRQRHGILLDPIYTGKLLCGLLNLAAKGHFERGSTVLAIHTGGLQAWVGFGGEPG
ncbi:1-aminocyclopropane-1-carboxylate deaminase/D-cysteine desulfhydrase [Hymenobacter psychrophilus]|uniref:1-aminocyclopropane-1-carboxylate deaminase/D-cysteine desulfhydrase, PLP-dependent ACC family n=1 Tax=Hymenobacter psychrophilus TaxID=651662 RepID=A0A1H3MJH0_9BACT|nr:pyridoxal-phosphate dependent enzyme [Hymenobacter psychrophilus]SDY76726.1 1-aminocyclopropane-1-carboxylate deaminase/D-cysteine desulfhydrase, PLP-dependent ACC family [Hymenobacter psychrophilus]